MRSAILVICVAAGALLVRGQTGIAPRPSASNYPAQQNAAGLTVAAALLSTDQAKQQFEEDLNTLGYMVVEVAFYPEPSRKVDVAARDFVLRLNPAGTTVQPVNPKGLPPQLQANLDHQALPEGPAAEPVAGYLYFPKLPVNKLKKGSVDLTWNGPGGPVRVTLLTIR